MFLVHFYYARSTGTAVLHVLHVDYIPLPSEFRLQTQKSFSKKSKKRGYVGMSELKTRSVREFSETSLQQQIRLAIHFGNSTQEVQVRN